MIQSKNVPQQKNLWARILSTIPQLVLDSMRKLFDFLGSLCETLFMKFSFDVISFRAHNSDDKTLVSCSTNPFIRNIESHLSRLEISLYLWI